MREGLLEASARAAAGRGVGGRGWWGWPRLAGSSCKAPFLRACVCSYGSIRRVLEDSVRAGMRRATGVRAGLLLLLLQTPCVHACYHLPLWRTDVRGPNPWSICELVFLPHMRQLACNLAVMAKQLQLASYN